MPVKSKAGAKPAFQADHRLDEEVWGQIAAAVKQIKHGTVTIIVQDSKVVQIDKTEKLRLK